MVKRTDISSDLHLVCSSGHHFVALVFSTETWLSPHGLNPVFALTTSA